MANELYVFLKDFLAQHSWTEEHVPHQVRAVFTTLCLTADIPAKTKITDDMLVELYQTGDVISWFMTFTEFAAFMYMDI